MEAKSLMERMDIKSANCETCVNLGSDGDGPEYNGNWPVCEEFIHMSNLKSFPFKKDMKCWEPNFWYSKFAAEMIKHGTDVELSDASKAFNKELNS